MPSNPALQGNPGTQIPAPRGARAVGGQAVGVRTRVVAAVAAAAGALTPVGAPAGGLAQRERGCTAQMLGGHGGRPLPVPGVGSAVRCGSHRAARRARRGKEARQSAACHTTRWPPRSLASTRSRPKAPQSRALSAPAHERTRHAPKQCQHPRPRACLARCGRRTHGRRLRPRRRPVVVQVRKRHQRARRIARQVHRARGQRGRRPAPGAQAGQARGQAPRALCAGQAGIRQAWRMQVSGRHGACRSARHSHDARMRVTSRGSQSGKLQLVFVMVDVCDLRVI